MEEEYILHEKLHEKNIKDIQNEGRGVFLMMVKLGKEDNRHQQVLKEYNEKMEKKLKETPVKITEFKFINRRHTNFGIESVESEIKN
jgi:hypothetical protein